MGKEKEKKIIPFTQQPEEASNHFSQEELTKYWIEYADSLTIQKVHLKNTLRSCRPILKEQFSFEVAVYNPSQKDEISDSSTDILGYLYAKLNNTHLKMEIRVAEKDEKAMIYTASEKYDYLSKKNPTLEKLKDIFNLTLE